jgi:UDP-GlcNAc:undecaprenyl-phosphate GlcNAc-1-phosphate transferase
MISVMTLSNVYLVIFAVAMMGCVLATPWVTRVAAWVGAVDRPDQFRRIHQGAIPRLGGLGLAIGVASGLLLPSMIETLRLRTDGLTGLQQFGPLLGGALIILLVGFLDDTRSLGPRVKLLGQAAAVVVLFLGGIRIEAIDVLDLTIDLSQPALPIPFGGISAGLPLPSLIVTLFWFLGCMNVWNLIDGMDGLASGVGLLVSGTLTLVAIHNENFEVAVLSVALAGSLAGFLLFNWHPACIFLGDSGSLLIGLLIGVIGVQGSLKGPSAISILFPILAMGLPISDTAMAIFRRWVRNLPLSAADRRHVHHLLIGLGLNPRQAALMLYSFSGFLCGAVMLGVALRSEYLALILGISGCLAFILVVTSRRDELTSLRGDFRARFVRSKQERSAAKMTWEAIQRIECCPTSEAAYGILAATSQSLGCRDIRVFRHGTNLQTSGWVDLSTDRRTDSVAIEEVKPKASLRLSTEGIEISAELSLATDSEIAADIAFRYMRLLAQAFADRLEWFQAESTAVCEVMSEVPSLDIAESSPAASISEGTERRLWGWLSLARILGRPSSVIPGPDGAVAKTFNSGDPLVKPHSLARR